MKVLEQAAKTAFAAQSMNLKGSDPSEANDQMPDYSIIMIEAQRIGNPLVLDELKSFYNIK